jgi:DNA-binding beta-propeller fold protein YncE
LQTTSLLALTSDNTSNSSCLPSSVAAKLGQTITRFKVSNPSAMAVNPTTNTVYVTDFEYDSTYVIDSHCDDILNSVAVGKGSFSIAVNQLQIWFM